MIYLVTFADGQSFLNTRNLFDKTLDVLHVDKHIAYTRADIVNTEFYRQNDKIFKSRIGFGLYIWKPYIISDQLAKVDDNDYIFYCDCSQHVAEGFTKSINPAIQYMETNKLDIMPGIPQKNLTNGMHTSDDCINRIKMDYDFDVNAYKSSQQYTAGHLIIKKTERSVKFISEWLKYCQIYKCIQKKRTSTGFNNCDMAVLNVLLFAYSIKNPYPPLDKYISRSHNVFLSQYEQK